MVTRSSVTRSERPDSGPAPAATASQLQERTLARAQRSDVGTDVVMTRARDILSPEQFAVIVDAYGLVDAAGLAEMIGRSHRTVMAYAAAEMWRTGHLPPPLYIGPSAQTRCGRGRRWRRSTVRLWLAAVEADDRGVAV